ncbi:hypothetical protein BDV28DRAFT_126526 [Aspergillus coremiiformis]|uniref:Uncharacterized protein n=1 Tax=Aspergillus coremiiformis TaxID=138285 RepID=A0A5N6ZKU1_9EURO|nr:hypothetical protein BDV28DRAFT_126526 [Aspergillus coremiiformis]
MDSTQIYYVDVQPYFESHRWCENADGSWHEPDSGHQGTYFFLSDWPDVPVGTNDVNTAEEEAAELSALIAQGSIPVPDAATCRNNLGTDPDPYAVAMCDVAINVAQNSTGTEAEHLAKANEALASGNYSADSISWYLPTRQVKTFHPRSSGMIAYRNAIIAAL